jgi:hypothetical protein
MMNHPCAGCGEVEGSARREHVQGGLRMRRGPARGRKVTRALYQQLRDEEVGKLPQSAASRMTEAVALVDALVLADDFVEFLTIPAYARLE